MSVALAEDGDFFAADEVATALAEGDFLDAAEVDVGDHKKSAIVFRVVQGTGQFGRAELSGIRGSPLRMVPPVAPPM